MADPIELMVSLTDKVSGPAAKAAGGLEDLADAGGSLDAIMPGLGSGLKIAGSVLVGMAVAIGTAVVGLSALALEASEARERMETMFDAMGEGQTSGKAVIGMLDDLSSKVGMTREKLAPLAQQFMAMGIRDLPKLEAALKASASAEALVAGGAEKFGNLMKKITEAAEAGGKLKLSSKALGTQLAGMGLDLDDVAKAMGMTSKALAQGLKAGTVDATKFGNALQKALTEKGAGPLDKMSSSLSFLKEQFISNIKHLFEDVDVSPFLAGLKDMVMSFGKGTGAGKTLHEAITTGMNLIFKAAAKALPYVKIGLLMMVKAGLQAYIALKPGIATIQKLWAESAKGGMASKIWNVLAMTLRIAGTSFVLLAQGITKAIQGFAVVMGWAGKAKSFAGDFVQGLADGISNGTGIVISAIKNLGGSAIDALKGALHISSPSKVAMKIGAFTGQGMAIGLKGAQGDVARAATGSATAGTSAMARAGGKSAGGRGAITINVGGITIGSVATAEEAQKLTAEAMADVFDRLAVTQGLGTL